VPKKAYFDEKAAKWDTLIQDEVVIRLRNMVEELALPKGSKVLDLGTGTGVLIPMLIEAVGSSSPYSSSKLFPTRAKTLMLLITLKAQI